MSEKILFAVLILFPPFLFSQTTDSGIYYEISTDTSTYFYGDTIRWTMSIVSQRSDTITLNGVTEDTYFTWYLKNFAGESFDEFIFQDSTYTLKLSPGDTLTKQWVTELPITSSDATFYYTTLPGRYNGIARPMIESVPESFPFDTTEFRISGDHPRLDFSVTTEEHIYQQEDTLDILITAENTTTDSIVLRWPDGCQASYWLDGQYHGRACYQIPTEVVIPGDTSHSWTLRHYPGEEHVLDPGVHYLTGEVIDYGITDTIAFVIADENFSYFPMDVGYSWTLAGETDTISEVITRTVQANSREYFQFSEYRKEPDVLFRQSDNRIYRYYDSTDVLWYDFTAAVGDTWHLPSPLGDGDGYSVMILEKTDTTVQTPQNGYEHCFQFYHFIAMDHSYREWFAPNLGVVKRNHYGFVLTQWSLLTANVGTDFNTPEMLPGTLQLHPVFPNPFNIQTTITYSLPKSARVSVTVYDIRGEKIQTLVSSKMTGEGTHTFTWAAENLASGVYFISVSTPSQQVSKKAILLK